MAPPRQYDIIVFGASGYTGKMTAEYITANLATDLRWALAGRSQSKLESIAAECKALNADRVQPGKLRIQLNYLIYSASELHFAANNYA
jgi:short subunit dehydrogenase-like uncharacterized protein